jgi:hypothetical protein
MRYIAMRLIGHPAMRLADMVAPRRAARAVHFGTNVDQFMFGNAAVLHHREQDVQVPQFEAPADAV